MGLFILYWRWLAFNSGSTYGLSDSKWIYSARAAVMTMLASFGGGIFSLLFSLFKNEGLLDVIDVINGILGALVSVTGNFDWSLDFEFWFNDSRISSAGCFLYNAWDAIVVGLIGAIIVGFGTPIFDKLGSKFGILLSLNRT